MGRIETADVETCTDCGRDIHAFQTPFIHDNRIICGRCRQKRRWKAAAAAALGFTRRYGKAALAQSVVRSIAWTIGAWLLAVLLLLAAGMTLKGITIAGGWDGLLVRLALGGCLLLISGGLIIGSIYAHLPVDDPHIPEALVPRQHWLCGHCGLRTARRAKFCVKCGSRDIRRD